MIFTTTSSSSKIRIEGELGFQENNKYNKNFEIKWATAGERGT